MEQYLGIKFNVRFLDERILNYSVLDQLIEWGEKLSKLGCIPKYPHPEHPEKTSSAGNLSARIGDRFLITAAGSNLGALTKKDFIEIINIDIPSRQIDVNGTEEPSSETMLHYSIYQKRNDAQVIFHGHNQHLLAHCSQLGLKSTKKWYPYGTLELMESVCEVLGKDDTILIMKDHGFLSFGKTCQQAGENIIRVLSEIKNIEI